MNNDRTGPPGHPPAPGRDRPGGILIIEDDEAMREVLAWEAREVAQGSCGPGATGGRRAIDVTTAPDGRAGLRAFDPARHAVVLTDLRMPGVDGMAVLGEVRRRSPDTLVIVITAYGDIPTAVEAVKAGAYDFIAKPFDRDHLRAVLGKALEIVALRGRVADLEDRLEWGERALVFASRGMREVVDLVDRVAQSDATVLFVGESGTGKEVLARRLHARSGRRAGPFVAVNAGAIPRDLIESDLFGHVQGAFTGAVRDHRGRFEQAHGGTLFLDEISEMPLDLQPKILRVLEERVVPVVGLAGEREVDVRLVAATNVDLQAMVTANRFRRDLYYRLNVVQVRVPPLRERPEDIPLLVGHFLKKWAGGPDRTGSPGQDLDVAPRALAVLRAAPWPGNVRELENVCRRFCLLATGGRVTEAMAVEAVSESSPASPLGDEAGGRSAGAGGWGEPLADQTLWDIERAAIERALRVNGYNQARAARALGIPRHVLLYRMKKFGILRGPGRG